MHFLYKTTNRITRKFYIGVHSTNDLHDGYYGSGKRLRKSLRKYGQSNHVFELLEMFETRAEAYKREEEVVNAKLLENPMCMNIALGGNYASYWRWRSKLSDETKAKMSATLKGRPLSDEHKAKISAFQKGRHKTEETRAKLSAANRGRVVSEETKVKISAAKKGCFVSEEKKAKISAFQKGRPRSEETKAKTSASMKGKNTGKKMSDEGKAKISAARKGCLHSDETKAKLSASQKARWKK